MYELKLSFEVNGEVSDSSHTRFGIREITSEVTEPAPNRAKRLFKINGKNISFAARLDSGHDAAPNPRATGDEFNYVHDLGLNTVRLEGKLETEEFFEMADQQGILVMADGAAAISGSTGELEG